MWLTVASCQYMVVSMWLSEWGYMCTVVRIWLSVCGCQYEVVSMQLSVSVCQYVVVCIWLSLSCQLLVIYLAVTYILMCIHLSHVGPYTYNHVFETEKKCSPCRTQFIIVGITRSSFSRWSLHRL